MAAVGKELILGDEFHASDGKGLGVALWVTRLVEILKVMYEPWSGCRSDALR